MNVWSDLVFVDKPWHNSYAIQGFPITGENLRTDNFTGKIAYYFEVQCCSE
jgi:hypothetical protein